MFGHYTSKSELLFQEFISTLHSECESEKEGELPQQNAKQKSQTSEISFREKNFKSIPKNLLNLGESLKKIKM